jgi:hypothetical protein
MSEAKHTPEPWKVQTLHSDGMIVTRDRLEIVTPEWDVVTGTPGAPPIRRSSDASRIVACVNALAGMNPEAVAELVEAARQIVEFGYQPGRDGSKLRAALAALEVER